MTTSRLLLVLILPFFFTNAAIAYRPLQAAAAPEINASKDGRLGGWRPIIDVSDPHVIDIGKFAVAENNKEHKTALVFVKVVRGEAQVVAGTNYRLVVEVAGTDTGATDYEAVVWEKEWLNFRQLTSFKPI